MQIANSGNNLFLTGAPGTGKSHTLRNIIRMLEAKHGLDSVLKVAPTGAAALLIQGQTIQSFPGPGVPGGTVKQFKNMSKSSRWSKVKAIVIDEVSMLDAEFFEWYVECLPSKKPQVVLCGDFFQLPPVGGGRSSDSLGCEDSLAHYIVEARQNGSNFEEASRHTLRVLADEFDPSKQDGGWKTSWETTPFGLSECKGKYIFQTFAFRNLRPSIVELTHVYRTSDIVLLQAQRAIREGRTEDSAVAQLVASAMRPLDEVKGVQATMILPLKRDVAEINAHELEQLPADSRKTYLAKDQVVPRQGLAAWVYETLKNDAFFRTECQADPSMQMRIGAQVMLLRNEAKEFGSLVNGSRGVVIGFAKKPVAYEGGMFVPPESDEEDKEDNTAGTFILDANLSEYTILFPIVRFIDGQVRLILPHEFKKVVYGKGECFRTQLPITLAWGVTVHKTQGSSLDRAIVDLQGTFADGQAYVAMSRARTLEGLQIRNFIPSAVKTDPLVRDFYAVLHDPKALDAFLDRSGMWWGDVVAQQGYTKWLALFRRHPSFKAWDDSRPRAMSGSAPVPPMDVE